MNGREDSYPFLRKGVGMMRSRPLLTTTAALILLLLILQGGTASAAALEAKLIQKDSVNAYSVNDFGQFTDIDGETAVVGANFGEMYVFQRKSDGSWIEMQELIQSETAMGDGDHVKSLAIADDTIVSGSSLTVTENSEKYSVGAAYIFQRKPDGTWVEVQILTRDDAKKPSSLNDDVAIDSDAIVVGATTEDIAKTNTVDAGAAYVFRRKSNGKWEQAAKLTASDAATNDLFGQSVSVSGNTLVVGASEDDNRNGEGAGSAYVFKRRSDGTWVQKAKLVANDGAPNDDLGEDVAISGNTMFVGADGDDNENGENKGSVYVFQRSPDGTWIQKAKLVASDGAIDENENEPKYAFGQSVSVSGDRALVTSKKEDIGSGSDFTGSAYVFQRQANGDWVEAEMLIPSDEDDEDRYGISAALHGSRAIVGASDAETSPGVRPGAAYVFTLDQSSQPQ